MNFLFSSLLNAQVGVNTDKPDARAGLHVSERKDPSSADPDFYNGIIIQRYTEAQRDARLTPNMNTGQHSLMIYNTTEDCYNYWNNIEQEWKSLCGALGKSQFTFDCAAIEVRGTYVEGRELTASNYLSIPVTVTKAGEYTVIVTTTNGYSFFTSGTFLNTGSYTIQVVGQGTPVLVQADNLSVNANGIDIACNPVRTVTVMSAAGTYTMACGTATVNGVYTVGVALAAANTITLPVNVSVLGSYTITTNTVDGISFSGSGTFTSIGSQNITLQGTGTPSSTTTKTLTITSDSQGSVSTSCNVDVVVVIPAKRLLTIGTSENGYGYNFSGNAASNRLITTATNYGTQPNSVVKFAGWQITNGTNAPTTAQLNNWLLSANPVDVVVLGYSWTMSDEDADVLTRYLARGGVVIAYSESNSGIQRLCRSLFADSSINAASVNSAGALYRLPYTDDEILNGPFGDIRGMKWGEDASSTTYLTNLPGSEIIIYSDATNLSTANPSSTAGRVTAFRHRNLNFIWVGDGGFNSNENSAATTICPFRLNASNFPIPKPAYGNGGSAYRDNVYNSVFTANAFAWAIKRAEFNGINTQ